MRARSKLVLLMAITAIALVPAADAYAKKRKRKAAAKPAIAATISPEAAPKSVAGATASTTGASESDTAAPALKGSVPPEATQTAVTAPAPPEAAQPAKTWSDAEIKTAKAECEALLIGLTIDFTYRQPIRDGACGTPMPVEVRSIGAHPKVAFDPPAVMNCRLLAKLVTWFATGVQPQARTALKSPVVAVRNASSYACRNRYNALGGKLSEHATANALDISSFTLESGTTVAIESAWGPNLRSLVAAARAKAEAEAAANAPTAPPQPAAFTTAKASGNEASDKKNGASALKKKRLQEAKELGIAKPQPKTPEAIFVHGLHDTACAVFGTVLGPEANQAHEDHLHVDLQPRRGGAFCE